MARHFGNAKPDVTRHGFPLRVTGIYAACHLVVDLACVTTMLGVVAPTLGVSDMLGRAAAIVAYDMLAFCLQLPIGALLDMLGPRGWRGGALASLAMVAAGVWCVRLVGNAPLVAALVLVAVGNALFHCAGGEEVLAASGERAAPSGIFISTGAIGVVVGGMAAWNTWAGVSVALVAALAVCALLVLASGPLAYEWRGLSLELGPVGWLTVVLLAATVVLRAYVGAVMTYPWKVDAGLAWCALAAVVGGKAAGGVVSDRLGASATAVLSLGAAAPLFLLSWENAAAGLGATFLFNFTMAITLTALARLMPEARGLAFGVASFSLAIGALPVLLGFVVTGPQVLCGLSLASLVLLASALLLSHWGQSPT